jgi:long-chain acyl-CoA synthetase
MYRRLADSKVGTPHSDLRLAIVSGAPCPASVVRDVRQRMGIPMIERYGMTEASPLTWHQVTPETAPGDVGRPAWGVHVRAVDASGQPQPPGQIGELEVRSPSMMLRYLGPKDAADPFREGWFPTGDLGAVRGDGGVTLTGRQKEVILTNGYTVAPREVQLVIQRHPAVAEAEIIGLPDTDAGEEVAAAVVLRKGKKATAQELEQHVGEYLAPWKKPSRWRIVAALPVTALGKVNRESLTELFAEPAEGSPGV